MYLHFYGKNIFLISNNMCELFVKFLQLPSIAKFKNRTLPSRRR